MPTRHAPSPRAHGLEGSPETIDPAGRGFTIGQAATFAGVTVAMVQLYHQDGLVDEPHPDGVGCRRYRSAETLRLVQVRTLLGAGVPPTEVRPLLDYLDHVAHLLNASGSSGH
ncbi:MerR family transcriptional regulator [Nocardia mangyaensis]|uniref:MerR family transcriptional regulator n=1 Tax=Nocardia mangyaensis TaxID=2213200 RepID=UPI002674B803|nr:MerR family transcriptional regulator [Nocardia mangyaensis]MDO3648261.1 MerR family transcriptional regulator [Nocardia mangyaensis]